MLHQIYLLLLRQSILLVMPVSVLKYKPHKCLPSHTLIQGIKDFFAQLFTFLALPVSPKPLYSVFWNSSAPFHSKYPCAWPLLYHLVPIAIWLSHEALFPEALLGRWCLCYWVSWRLSSSSTCIFKLLFLYLYTKSFWETSSFREME